jgi:acyl-coenzyme A synthetase/AMP-(fatty) acid ligase
VSPRTALAPSPSRSRLPWLRSLGELALGEHGGRPALVTADGALTYADLADRVAGRAERLAGPRRLVLLEGANTVETVVSYLAAHAAGHAVLLAGAGPDGPADRLRAAYDPDLVLGPDGTVEVVRAESAHDLHPDLALLLSTSGSTGSAKLVRLSWENLAANTAQICEYLAIRAEDCAATTLPLTYCYGLSVLQTHLACGAAVLLTDLSVVDPCFWTLFRSARATTFAAVPHTFELLERVGFDALDLPHLRYVTQAGGRMDPDRVREWADVGQACGWDLFVMYGQTEATARMAYLPPELALEHPGSVGVAVPGGDLTIEDGEIVYRGPNVMLGYAETPADLAVGRTVEALHTGDLGRVTDAGLLEVTGRKARFVKVLGHRVDLDTLEQRLRASGADARCAGRDGCIVVATRSSSAPARESLQRKAVQACGVPRCAMRVVAVDEHPTLATGKTDYAAVLRLVNPPIDSAALPIDSAALPIDSADCPIAALYAALLHRDDVAPDSTFAALGGDSLSYVEVSVRLEELLERLPVGWHLMTVAELEELRPRRQDGSAAAEPAPRRRWRTMESSVWLRALAILLIVGTHAGLFSLQGTANALLALAGYQLVRFQLADPSRRARVRGIARSVVRVVVPSLVVIWAAHLVGGHYETRNLFLANWAFGQEQLGPPWRFWFIEALVVALVVTALLSAVPFVSRLDRRHPLGLPLALTFAAFAFRLPLFDLPVPRMHGSALVVLHLFFLGWALARVGTHRERVLLTVVTVGVVGTFSFNPARDGLTLGVLLLLLWKPVTRVPAVLVPAIQVLAAASLFIYVIHWQALELLWGRPVLAFAGSMALGLAYWWCWTHLSTWASRLVSAVRAPSKDHCPARTAPAAAT